MKKKRLLQTSLSIFILMLPLAWLYMDSELGMSRKAHEVESLLQEIMHVDTQLTEQVLKTRSQITLHYDDIADSQRRLNSLVGKFTPDLISHAEALEAQFTLIASLSKESQQTIERFKSINAQVSQRQRYIRVLASEIKKNTESVDAMNVVNQVDEIVIEVFNARLFGHRFIESDATQHIEALLLASRQHKEIARFVDNFIVHLNQLLLLEEKESVVLNDILEHRMREKIQQLRHELNESQYQMVLDGKALQNHLIVYASFLLILILFFILNRRYLQKHASIHKRRSELDHLTKLYNRRYFLELLKDVIEDESGALLFIDLDDFKIINDELGHSVGDETLKSVALRLTNLAEKAESKGFSSNVFRLGGDEFVILVEHFGYEDPSKTLVQFAQSVVDECAFEVKNAQQAFKLSVSVGIARFPEHGVDVTTVLNCADKAMYYSKQHGRNRFTLYSDI